MGTTEPIRNKEDLQALLAYFKTKNSSGRNFLLISMGIYTALRISDMLNLRWKDLYDFEHDRVNQYLELKEKKTGKKRRTILHPKLQEAVFTYYNERNELQKVRAEDYVFSMATRPEQPISRTQAWRIIKKAAQMCMEDAEHISCHSLRKTFGYHAWKQGAQPALLMEIFNHSSYRVTKKYLGIRQDECDELFLNIRM